MVEGPRNHASGDTQIHTRNNCSRDTTLEASSPGYFLKEPPSSEKAAEEHSTTQQEASHSLATPVEETPGKQPTTVLNTSQSFAKHYMGVKMGETKLLGRPWNETVDTIELAFPVPIVKVT